MGSKGSCFYGKGIARGVKLNKHLNLMISMKEETIRKILYFGDQYKKKLDRSFQKDHLERDWYNGLSLFLNHSFYQGRRDDVSEKVERAAMPVLDRCFKNQDTSALANCNFDLLSHDLAAVVGKGKVGKERDVRMVVSIFRFLLELPEKNLTRYSVAEIEQSRLRELYDALRGIIQIGPKIASFYLRDLVDIYDLESKIRAEDLKYLQPIDVWVRKVVHKTGIVGDDKLPDENIREDILSSCQQLGISAFRFNQGAWYVGKNAFEILIEHLDSIRISPNRYAPK